MSEEIKQDKLPSESPKEEKNGLGKWLKIGGILCAIAGCSALLLTALNLVTAPVIQQHLDEKQNAGYKQVFSNWAANGEAIAIEDNPNLAEYCIAYSDTAKTQQIGFIYTTKSLAVKSYGNLKAMIGITGETDSPVLGKVYMLENSLSYKGVLETGYIEKYNQNPSDATLNNVKCGATFGAEALQGMINAARDHYTSIGDPFQEDLAQDIKDIWGEGSAYTVENSKESNVSGAQYVKKAYSFFEDDTKTGEIGRLYSAKSKDETGDIYLTVSFTGVTDLGKLVITKNTLTDTSSLDAYITAYNANPSEETLNATNGAASERVKAMVLEAKTTLTTDGGLKSSKNYFKNIVADGAYVSVSEPTALSKDDKKINVLRYWSLYSDEGKTTEVAKIYKVQSIMKAVTFEPIESNTVFLIAISGEKENPALGKITILHNEVGNSLENVVEDYVNKFDESKGEPQESQSGATYTLRAIWEGTQKAKALYSETK